MAFVYRNERHNNTSETMTPPKIGPGSYIAHQPYNFKPSKNAFNSSDQRLPEIKIESPGPGSYQVANEYQREKIIASNINMDVKIIEIPKPNSIFKSTSTRFKDPVNRIPGPGDYENNKGTIEIFSDKYIRQPNQKNSEIFDFIKSSNNTNIPSIPTKVSKFGYTEYANILYPNKNTFIKFAGDIKDSVGPGEYNAKFIMVKKQQRSANFHTSNKKSIEESNEKEKKGPGSYNPIVATKINNHKSTASFMASSKRLFDLKKGEVKNKFIFEKLQEQSKISQASTHDNWMEEGDFEDEIEYIEDATPGPGYYYNEEVSTCFSKKKNSKSNMSKFTRFKESLAEHNLGPGQYAISKDILFKNKKTNKINSAPFFISDPRFKEPSKLDVPGPGSYQALNLLEKKIKDKNANSISGKYFSTEKRFINEELTDENPGPGEYIPLESHQPVKKIDPSFKSVTIRKLWNTDERAPPMNTYDIANFNIANSSLKNVELDKELASKKPHFGSTEMRFVELRKLEKEEEKNKKEAQNNPNRIYCNDSLEKLIEIENKKPPFNSKDARFNYNLKEITPGPGEYNSLAKMDWNRRSYNVLFIEEDEI